jgi:hypothetical protein
MNAFSAIFLKRLAPKQKASVMAEYSLTPGVLIERVGDDLMVIVPGKDDFVRLSGHVAGVLLDIQAGRRVTRDDLALLHLIELGVVVAPGISRRGLIRAGSVGVATGVAVMALPAVAAASSGSCFSPSSFNVGVGLYDNDDGYEYLTVNFDRPNIPVGLIATIPNGHPGTFTPTSGPSIAVVWQSEYDRFATFLDPVIPFTEEDALRFGSVTFTLDGCTYTGTGDILDA